MRATGDINEEAMAAAPLSVADAATDAEPASVVRALPVPVRDDAALLAGLRAGEAWARAGFFDRYAPAVKRILRRVLGPAGDPELPDLVQDAFLEALRSIDRVREASTLAAWMQSIAAHTALRAIRRRSRKKWLRFWEPADLEQAHAVAPNAEACEALSRTYAALDRLDAEQRLAFTLRYVEGLELVDVASACGVSLATVKRRLARAEQRFVAIAQGDAVLRRWLEEGGRWTT